MDITQTNTWHELSPELKASVVDADKRLNASAMYMHKDLPPQFPRGGTFEMLISGEELRKALKEVEEAEAAGLNATMAIFSMRIPIGGVRHHLDERRAFFANDCNEMVRDDPRFDYGRGCNLRKTHNYIDGQFVKKENNAGTGHAGSDRSSAPTEELRNPAAAEREGKEETKP